MLNKIVVFIFLCALSSGLGAQSNQVLDKYIESPQADWATTVYLVMTASGTVPEDVPPPVALLALNQKDWGFAARDAKSPQTWGDFSLLAMRAFQLKGGLLYTLFPNTRYAAREMNFRRILPYEKNSGDSMTSMETLLALQNIMESTTPLEALP